jgi:hypothetical protein
MRSGAVGETLFPNIERRYGARQDRRAHQTQHSLLMCAPPRPALAPHQPQARSPAPRLAPPSPEPSPNRPPGRRASGSPPPGSHSSGRHGSSGPHSSRPRARSCPPAPTPTRNVGDFCCSSDSFRPQTPGLVAPEVRGTSVTAALRCVGSQRLQYLGLAGRRRRDWPGQAALSAGRGARGLATGAMCTLPRLQPVQSEHCPGCGPKPAVTPAPGVSSTPESQRPAPRSHSSPRRLEHPGTSAPSTPVPVSRWPGECRGRRSTAPPGRP